LLEKFIARIKSESILRSLKTSDTVEYEPEKRGSSDAIISPDTFFVSAIGDPSWPVPKGSFSALQECYSKIQHKYCLLGNYTLEILNIQ
jgi:hypothetical protein